MPFQPFGNFNGLQTLSSLPPIRAWFARYTLPAPYPRARLVRHCLTNINFATLLLRVRPGTIGQVLVKLQLRLQEAIEVNVGGAGRFVNRGLHEVFAHSKSRAVSRLTACHNVWCV